MQRLCSKGEYTASWSNSFLFLMADGVKKLFLLKPEFTEFCALRGTGGFLSSIFWLLSYPNTAHSASPSPPVPSFPSTFFSWCGFQLWSFRAEQCGSKTSQCDFPQPTVQLILLVDLSNLWLTSKLWSGDVTTTLAAVESQLFCSVVCFSHTCSL